jgi:hypothetical protein
VKQKPQSWLPGVVNKTLASNQQPATKGGFGFFWTWPVFFAHCACALLFFFVCLCCGCGCGEEAALCVFN